MSQKPVVWLGSSLLDVRAFPRIARQRIGRALDLVQDGHEPPDWKPMARVGLGVREIRVKIGTQYRVLYVAKYAEAVYVLHAFAKTSQKTSERDLALGRKRLSMVQRSPTEKAP